MQMIFGSSKALVADLDVLNLSGTQASPQNKEFTALEPRTATVAWLFGCNDAPVNSILSGQTQFTAHDDLTFTPQYISVNTATDWVIPIGFSITYYIRATLDSGDAPTSGDLLGVWLSLAPGGANRVWTWLRVNLGNHTGVLKIEIATDSAGTDIVATGYYRAKPEVAL